MLTVFVEADRRVGHGVSVAAECRVRVLHLDHESGLPNCRTNLGFFRFKNEKLPFSLPTLNDVNEKHEARQP